MTVPIEEQRPNDQLYNQVKDNLDKIKNETSQIRDQVTKLLVEDMTADLALSQSVDEIGVVLEYLIQELSIERPSFDADDLLRNLRRITKLSTSYKMTQVFELPEDLQKNILRAEMERLWFDPLRQPPMPQVKVAEAVETKIPYEITQLLSVIAKHLSKK